MPVVLLFILFFTLFVSLLTFVFFLWFIFRDLKDFSKFFGLLNTVFINLFQLYVQIRVLYQFKEQIFKNIDPSKNILNIYLSNKLLTIFFMYWILFTTIKYIF